ncbi:hypothetical protein MA16_Dca003134 [Dendrobium catenatum]|uniref:Uncharacterized protein n=1 Tax=Dendrobium catenatum TaxID=906689 RepID=A0A2I0XBW3_9ASPA|nr:hypothetical protein MA16_Dca003134 [Dendrobium catenatum]
MERRWRVPCRENALYPLSIRGTDSQNGVRDGRFPRAHQQGGGGLVETASEGAWVGCRRAEADFPAIIGELAATSIDSFVK